MDELARAAAGEAADEPVVVRSDRRTELDIQTVLGPATAQLPWFGYLGGAMFANGDVYPCELLIDRKIGNVRDAGYDFKKIWFSDEADASRRFIRETKCFCTYECFLTINILFNPRMMPAVLKEWSSLKLRKAWRRLTGRQPERATLQTCGAGESQPSAADA